MDHQTLEPLFRLPSPVHTNHTGTHWHGCGSKRGRGSPVPQLGWKMSHTSTALIQPGLHQACGAAPAFPAPEIKSIICKKNKSFYSMKTFGIKLLPPMEVALKSLRLALLARSAPAPRGFSASLQQKNHPFLMQKPVLVLLYQIPAFSPSFTPLGILPDRHLHTQPADSDKQNITFIFLVGNKLPKGSDKSQPRHPNTQDTVRVSHCATAPKGARPPLHMCGQQRSQSTRAFIFIKSTFLSQLSPTLQPQLLQTDTETQ